MTSQLDDWDVRPIPPDWDDELELVTVKDSTGQVHAAILPRAFRSSTPEQLAHLSGIQKRAIEVQALSEEIDELVRSARDLGVSWESLGFVLGTTGSAVRKRWGAPSEPR